MRALRSIPVLEGTKNRVDLVQLRPPTAKSRDSQDATTNDRNRHCKDGQHPHASSTRSRQVARRGSDTRWEN